MASSPRVTELESLAIKKEVLEFVEIIRATLKLGRTDKVITTASGKLNDHQQDGQFAAKGEDVDQDVLHKPAAKDLDILTAMVVPEE